MKENREPIWIETNPDGTVNVGLTHNFINQKLQECFHIIQADATDVKRNSPMLVLETNDGLESIKSPITGRILTFSDRARNFPDKLTEDDVIIKILPEGVKLPEKKRAVAKKKVVDEVAQPVQFNWDNVPPPAQAGFADLQWLDDIAAMPGVVR